MTIKSIIILTAAIAVCSAQPGSGSGPMHTDWVKLFNGHSLAGWAPEQLASWHVEDGAIVGDAAGDGWLRSSGEFTDFALKIEYRNSPKGNSGIFLRATKQSDMSDPSNPRGSYELQINNEDEKWPTGSIENFIPRLVAVNPAPGQWHSYEVEIKGDHITARLDGTKVLDGRNPKFKAGFIGLQHHKDSRIEFRNVSVIKLAE